MTNLWSTIREAQEIEAGPQERLRPKRAALASYLLGWWSSMIHLGPRWGCSGCVSRSPLHLQLWVAGATAACVWRLTECAHCSFSITRFTISFKLFVQIISNIKSSEPDVDLENQYYNSKALKESDPQVPPNQHVLALSYHCRDPLPANCRLTTLCVRPPWTASSVSWTWRTGRRGSGASRRSSRWSK